MILNPKTPHQAVVMYDCHLGNPNGDPNNDNIPRQDERGHGFVTDVCLKHKIKSAAELLGALSSTPERYDRLIKTSSVINQTLEEAYKQSDIPKPSKKSSRQDQDVVMKYILHRYFDARFFGAVLSTGDYPAGVYCGPFQIPFAHSFHPVTTEQITITRCAATNETEGKDNKTMGRKSILHYGLYQFKIFYSPHKDKFNLITEEDMKIFWDSVLKMFELDKSAARANMNLRGLYLFSHKNQYGDCPTQKLLNSIAVNCNVPSNESARSFGDYNVTIDQTVIEQFESVGGKFTIIE
jgi:CRISPR-associated protein Csd2